MKAAGNLSIFNKADGGQVNCCFQSHFSIGEQGYNKKLNYCFLSGFSWIFLLKFTNSIVDKGEWLQWFSFYAVVNKGNTFNSRLHWQAICHPFCPASVQPLGRAGVVTQT